ncbi:hypothetical protein [Nocardioides sp. SR21]|uniref:hypothetical protein n=1 Tax=Nocardioides sp. SR21 TaxID=2919501 RepID=UPI001FAA7659|nr:hypothetical protein [Nocardioides sp. SR21]
MHRLWVDYCGELIEVAPERPFGIGRQADLSVEDNPFLHRRIVELSWDGSLWWIANVGSRLSVTVSGGAGTLQSWVPPGARVPLVLPEVVVLFTAGETTYELVLQWEGASFEPVEPATQPEDGDLTLGAVNLTWTQFQLLVALAENSLRRAGTGASAVPTNAAAAARLGWPLTTFNRKLDNVCDKYSRAGVKGLRGGAGEMATNRRARLVEYVIAARIITADHLVALDEAPGPQA